MCFNCCLSLVACYLSFVTCCLLLRNVTLLNRLIAESLNRIINAVTEPVEVPSIDSIHRINK